MTIRTTHVGSLPRTPELLRANAERERMGEEAFIALLQESVDEVVTRQYQTGLDVVNDGEYGHMMTQTVDYGAWWFYSFTRLGGLDLRTDPQFSVEPAPSSGKVKLASFGERRDWQAFSDAYSDPASGIHIATDQGPEAFPVITGPLTYIGADAVRHDVEGLTHALDKNGIDRGNGFFASVAPGSAARIGNEYYSTEEEVLEACAHALHEEYKAITDAGFIVQIDDPSLAEGWDQVNPAPTYEDYREFVQTRVDALNLALEGIPEEQVRLHLCWGSWHGPHTTDIPLREIVDNVLTAKARYFSFEAANARHEHEWTVWQDVKLADDKVLVPGVVGHSTNVVEHPELVAQRIQRFVDIVGSDRVIASTDCGLGGRIYPSIAWAKLAALVEGARLVK